MTRDARPLLFVLGLVAGLLSAAGVVIVALALASKRGAGRQSRYGERDGL